MCVRAHNTQLWEAAGSDDVFNCVSWMMLLQAEEENKRIQEAEIRWPSNSSFRNKKKKRKKINRKSSSVTWDLSQSRNSSVMVYVSV